MKRQRTWWIGAVACALVMSVTGSDAAASKRKWARKPAHVKSEIKSPSRILQISRSNIHPWALTEHGADWFLKPVQRAAAKTEFHQFSEQNIRQYLAQGAVLDCADVALTNLADYLVASGRRMALKVYAGGAKYIDTADFKSPKEFAGFVRRYMGALNVIDNMRPVLRINQIESPADLARIQPGHARMKVHIPRTGRFKGRPSSGHTEPIVGVQKGETLADSKLEIIYGNLDNDLPTPVRSTTKWIEREMQPGALVADHDFDSLGKVRTVVAPVYDYKKVLLTNSPQREQAMAMGWSLLERGLK